MRPLPGAAPDRAAARGRVVPDGQARLAGEVAVEAQAERARLLRVELHRGQVARLDARHERDPVVVGHAQDVARRPRHHRIAVHEVEGGAVGDALEQVGAGAQLGLVPADVRHFDRGRQARTSPRIRPSPGTPGSSSLGFEEQLQAQADPEKRHARLDPLHERLDQPLALQLGHGRAEGAHARQAPGRPRP